ncbi:MAG TPA: phosphatase PAP2 family protein [Candidatus Acidoferrales bacterium]|nr:phosphatase PAP2 family protein [Candidatus Acidoferrales bacterium]
MVHERVQTQQLSWRTEMASAEQIAALFGRDEDHASHLATATGKSACLGPFERIALTYLAFSGALMLAYRSNLPNAGLHLGVHAAATLAIVAIADAPGIAQRRWPESLVARGARWIRHWYPQAVFLFCFEELRILVQLLHAGWRDSVLIHFDRLLTGVDPAVWFASISCPALNDFMQAAYLTYFFYLTVLGASLYRGREAYDAESASISPNQQRKAYWSVMTGSMAAYSIGYVISILFPIESPYFSMAALQLPELRGGPATSPINLIEHFGRVHGAAFPSAHVSGSFVALLGAWKYRRWMFWIFLPCFLAMCTATVYGRYHYVADVLGGIVVGAVGFSAGEWLTKTPARARNHIGLRWLRTPADATPAVLIQNVQQWQANPARPSSDR